MDHKDLKTLTNQLNYIYKLKGNLKRKAPIKNEKKSRLNARRSIVLRKNLKKK